MGTWGWIPVVGPSPARLGVQQHTWPPPTRYRLLSPVVATKNVFGHAKMSLGDRTNCGWEPLSLGTRRENSWTPSILICFFKKDETPPTFWVLTIYWVPVLFFVLFFLERILETQSTKSTRATLHMQCKIKIGLNCKMSLKTTRVLIFPMSTVIVFFCFVLLFGI